MGCSQPSQAADMQQCISRKLKNFLWQTEIEAGMKETVLHPDKIEMVWVGYICSKQMRLQKLYSQS